MFRLFFRECFHLRPPSSEGVPDATLKVEHSRRDPLIQFLRRLKQPPTINSASSSLINDMVFAEDDDWFCSLAYCKNKKHHDKGFIPVSGLELEHLPKGHRTPELLHYVQCLSQAVVKITVSYVSVRRPHQFPGYGEPRRFKRFGTGWVGQVSRDDDIIQRPCFDSDCPHKDDHDIIGPFYIITARHVVFDKSEAAATTIQFTDDDDDDDDDDDTGDYGSKSGWTAFGVDIAYTEVENRDFVFVKCYSHDLGHISRLVTISENIAKAGLNIYQENEETEMVEHKMGLIISHPHGLAKRISFGQCYGKLDKKDPNENEREVEFDMQTGQKRAGIVRFTYDIATCPGSSGAPVLFMGRDGAYNYLGPHSCMEGGELGSTEVLVERHELDNDLEPEEELSLHIKDPLSKKPRNTFMV